MDLNRLPLEKKFEYWLLSILKNTDTLNKQTKTKLHETLEFQKRKTIESVFLFTLELKDERMLGLTSVAI